MAAFPCRSKQVSNCCQAIHNCVSQLDLAAKSIDIAANHLEYAYVGPRRRHLLDSHFAIIYAHCGISLHRSWANELWSDMSLSAAGKYSEHAFQALDYILDEASKYGIRLLLTLVNNWDNADSKTQVSAVTLVLCLGCCAVRMRNSSVASLNLLVLGLCLALSL